MTQEPPEHALLIKGHGEERLLNDPVKVYTVLHALCGDPHCFRRSRIMSEDSGVMNQAGVDALGDFEVNELFFHQAEEHLAR